MNIEKYTSYFHDGSLFNILKLKSEIVFRMSSAEVELSVIEPDLMLSKNSRIRGNLHLQDIYSIHLTGDYNIENLFDFFSLGTILDFEIFGETIELGILWENFPPKLSTNEFTTITIKSKHIWWENIPNLVEPFW